MTFRKILFLIIGGISVVAVSYFLFLFVYSPNILKAAPLSVSFSHTPTINQEFSVLFIGDMMFDRGVRKTINKKGFEYVFGDSLKIFSGSDLVVGNLEGPITNFLSKTLLSNGSMPSDLIFTFPPETALALKKNGIGLVSLANNHEENFGQAGIDQTKLYLNQANISFFGDAQNSVDISKTICKNSICVGFIGFNQFSFRNENNISREIKKLKSKTDHIVIFAHWGEEYNTDFIPLQKALAHKWIDAGADLIIGAHPHVIEPIEIYKGKTIFYSLGNFIFDQYFSFDTTHGIGASINFTKNSYTYDVIPIQNTGIRITIPDPTTSSQILSEIKRIP